MVQRRTQGLTRRRDGLISTLQKEEHDGLIIVWMIDDD